MPTTSARPCGCGTRSASTGSASRSWATASRSTAGCAPTPAASGRSPTSRPWWTARRLRERARHRRRAPGRHAVRPARGHRRPVGRPGAGPPRPAHGSQPRPGPGARPLRAREPGTVSPARTRSACAVPYVLRLPPGWAPGEDSLASLLDLARTEQARTDQRRCSTSARTAWWPPAWSAPAAFARARLVAGPQEDLDDVVDDVSSVTWVDGETYGFTRAAGQAAGPPWRLQRPGRGRGRRRAADQGDRADARPGRQVARRGGHVAQGRRRVPARHRRPAQGGLRATPPTAPPPPRSRTACAPS